MRASHRVFFSLSLALGLLSASAGAAAATASVAAAPSGVVAFNSVASGPAILAEASRHAGKHYRWGAVGPAQFDCSGFTMYVFAKFGISLPHNSGAQSRATTPVPASQRKPGDLIFFHTGGGGISHVAIYAGGNSMWAAPRAGKSVRRTSIYSSRVTYGRVR